MYQIITDNGIRKGCCKSLEWALHSAECYAIAYRAIVYVVDRYTGETWECEPPRH